MNNVVLSDRKKVLQKIVTPIPRRIELVLGTEVNNVDEIMTQFNLALKNGEEGVVVKKLNSMYQPDKRCSDWVKMKCDYIDTIVDTLDLIIIGGYYGNTRTHCTNNDFIDKFHKTEVMDEDGTYTENVTSFLMGIVRSIDEENPKLSTILPLVRVGTGFNLTTLNSIRNKLKPYWKKYDSKMIPSLYGQWIPSISDRPDVYIDNPSFSVILEVKAAEIIPSAIYPSKLTLRFARVVKPRFDKTWKEALKYDELLNYYNVSISNVKKNNALFGGEGDEDEMQHKHIIKKNKRKDILNTIENNLIDDDISSDVNRDKRKKRNEFIYKLLPSFRDTDTSTVSKISNLFQGCQFLVLLLDDSIDQNSSMKQSLEYLIVEHGGEKVQNYLPTVTHIISNKIDFRAKNILKTNDVNVMKSKWVEDCVKNKKILKISPKYLTYANNQTKDLFAKTIDIYGDSYFEEVDLNGVESVFENIQIKNVDYEYEKCIFKMLKEYQNNEEFKNLLVEN